MSPSERLYRLLLRLYPPRFRFEYADAMTQLFLDQLRDVREGRDRRGLATTWLSTFADLGRSSLDERLRGDREVAHSMGEPPAAVDRLLGALGIAGGLVLLAAWFVDVSPTLNTGRLVLFNVGAIAIALGALRHFGRGRRRWAGVAAVLVVATNLAYAAETIYSLQLEHPFAGLGGAVYALIGMAMWATDAAFGLTVLRLGGLARYAGVALAAGVLGILGGDRFFEPTEVMINLALAGVALNGLGWVLLGIVVARRRRPVSAVDASVEARGGG